METVEPIAWNGKILAFIIRATMSPEKTTFVTPSELNFQVGFIVYPAGGTIARHEHRPLERNTVGTAEVLVVKKGRCEVDIYNDDRHLVATRELKLGDALFIAGGGHAFRMLEDTVFLEIKQGPYTGLDEKERF